MRQKDQFLRQTLVTESSAWPLILESLWSFESSLDLEKIGNALFALPTRGNLSELPTPVAIDYNTIERIQVAIQVLFQWCLTSYPKNNRSLPFVISSLLDKVRVRANFFFFN